jgi:trimethylamine--corrinoid protein Co-methyltransferase
MRELSGSDLFDWNTLEIWLEIGGKNLTERAYERVRYILENHKPMPLPDGAAEAMRSIIEDYEDELRIKK